MDCSPSTNKGSAKSELASRFQSQSPNSISGGGDKKKPFLVEIIKPSHYDNDGYVIQWFRAFVPSNSLACLYSLVQDVDHRRALGDDVSIAARVYDECHTVIPVQKIIRSTLR